MSLSSQLVYAMPGRPIDPAFTDLLVARLQASYAPEVPNSATLQLAKDGDADAEADVPATDACVTAKPPSPIPARRLLACIRLAATFGTAEALAPSRNPGALTLLHGIDVQDLDLVAGVLKSVLPDQGWTVLRPSVSDDAVSKLAGDRFAREIVGLVDTVVPALVLHPRDLALCAPLRQPGVTAFGFAPISADILLAHLRALDRLPQDADAFRLALPEPAMLARLDTAQTCMALRFGAGTDIADSIKALIGPVESGPRLEVGFSDSPAVRAARRMVADLMSWRRGEIGWDDCSHSLLLFGPPGTGKTWLARAMSNSAGIAHVAGSFAVWQAAGHLGDMLREMRLTFAQARRSAPSILSIDEIDAVGSRSSGDRHAQSYRMQVINGFLAEMDALATEPGVIVVGACNHPEMLDPAITRAGRFDIRIEVPMPDADAIFALLLQLLKAQFPQSEIRALSRELVGRSLAAVDAATRAARSEARHRGHPLDLPVLRELLGLKPQLEDTGILWRYAVHEAGRAVVGAALRQGPPRPATAAVGNRDPVGRCGGTGDECGGTEAPGAAKGAGAGVRHDPEIPDRRRCGRGDQGPGLRGVERG